MVLHNLLKDLQKKTSRKKAEGYKKFFKKTHLDKNDRFIGVSVKDVRDIAKKHTKTSTLQDVQKLLKSDIHEYRMLGGVILVNMFRYNKDKRKELFEFYLLNIKRFNNWDLVDTTCYKIMGWYLLEEKKKRKLLYTLVKDGNLWERRAAIVSTFEFIRHGDFGDTLKLAQKLLKEKHKLLQKPVGWMLKEIGKKDKEVLLDFLRENKEKISVITMNDAIANLSDEEKEEFLEK